MHILVIVDEKKTKNLIIQGLIEDDVTVTTLGGGLDRLELALDMEYDLLILDSMFSCMDTWKTLKRMRDKNKGTPVLLLTEQNDAEDRTKQLQFDSVDCFSKPFTYAELLMRIHTILCRSTALPHGMIRIGALEIDSVRNKVMLAGKRVSLTKKEFEIITLLARSQGEVFTRAQIADQIWDNDVNSETNAVDVHMHRLRGKVDKFSDRALIHTVRGAGYVLELR